ncbi:MAG TPA: ABC transporter permease [Candidatus Ruania gallistercoris]|uniref:ABC transporter permease n=1 Tax=Candidatus Ruania gallistercoris TaxID=2838746 RepID=A0A9D2EJ43_9MICO|nr:ABC transporter permease [Candidatus Ruania gallistercoris]
MTHETALKSPAPAPATKSNRLTTMLGWLRTEGTLLVALIVLLLILTAAAPNFMTLGNVLNIVREAAFVGIIAWGMTMVIISGEIDISVGSNVALSSALLGVLVAKQGMPIFPAVLIVLAVGTVIGMFAGLFRALLNVPSFIVTLALYLGLKGLALFITNAFPNSIPSATFNYFGAGFFFGIPVPALVLFALFLVFLFVSRKTAFGRSVYAVGGNAEAARLSGISVARVRIVVFTMTGLLAALVGVLLSARLSSGNPGIGTGLEFDVIAAVIIGGASLAGGRGTMLGTLLGVLFVTVLSNGLVLLGVNAYVQDIASGAIVLIAVLLSSIRKETEHR